MFVSPRAIVEQLTRIYAEPLLACVSDNRKMMRDAAIAALEKVTLVGGEREQVLLALTCVCHSVWTACFPPQQRFKSSRKCCSTPEYVISVCAFSVVFRMQVLYMFRPQRLY